MSLANPIGLLGLLTIPVVLGLHMLRERRQRYIMPHLALWSFLDKEVRGSRPRRIPITWILILDLALATLFGFALAEPHYALPLPEEEAKQTILVLDTSTSMLATDIRPSRFSQAKLQALTMLGELGPQDITAVYAFDTRARLLGDSRETLLPEIFSRLNALNAGRPGSNIRNAVAQIQEAVDVDLPTQIHIFTDAAFTQPIDAEELAGFEGASVEWHILGTGESNQAVVDLLAETLVTGELEIFTRVGNYGNQPARRLLTLILDGEPIDSTTVEIPPESFVTQVWTVSRPAQAATVSLIGNDPQGLDDSASIGLPVGTPGKVALVALEPEPVARALKNVPDLALQILAPNEYLLDLPFDLVIFKGYLPPQWPAGNVLVLDPPPDQDLLPVETLVEIDFPPAVQTDPITKDLDLNSVRWDELWSLTNPLEDFAEIVSFGGAPLLLRGSVGNSRPIVFLAPLDSGNFTRHPAFPIFLNNVYQASKMVPLPEAISLGGTLALPPPELYPAIHINLPDEREIEWGMDRPTTWALPILTGAYHAELFDLQGEMRQLIFGVNGAHPAELDLRPADLPALAQSDQVEDLEPLTRELNLTPWLLGMGVLFLCLEAWLAWR